MRKLYGLPQLRFTQRRGERPESQRFSRAVQTSSVIDGYLLSFNKNVTARKNCVREHQLRVSSCSPRLRVSLSLPALLVALLTLGVSSCRDAPAPPTEPERTDAPQNDPLQLTYSVQDDRAPSWSADGDTVYYAAHAGNHNTRPVTELRAISRTAGIARPAMPQLSAAGDTIWLADPEPSPDGNRIAFAHLEIYYTPEIQNAVWTCTGDRAARADSAIGPRLGIAQIYARDFESSAPLRDAKAAFVVLAGRTGLTGALTLVRYHPFQRLWDTERQLPFNPTWSADGQRLAFSDGLRVLTWQPGSNSDPQPVPGTNDGVRPAWSPDGSRIAYTRLERGDSARATCIIEGTFPPPPTQDRIVWEVGQRRLIVTTPDGNASVDLGIGEDPAWSPDGRYIYARRNDAIWRIAADGSSAVEIAGTSSGREPAVSPTGEHLAFARLTAKGDYDIWVAELK